MEKMLAVVFEHEHAADQGANALRALDVEGDISIHAQAVIRKNVDGSVTTKRVDEFPISTYAGSSIGALIGALGGPVGLGVGVAVGALAGFIDDLYASRVNSDFLAEVSKALTPGKCAVVADISEEWVTPVDTRMEALGGVVFRTLRMTAKDDWWDRQAATLRAEIDQLKAELARAHADRKAKLQAKIDQLSARREEKAERSKARSEQAKRELEAKVDALQKKAAKEKGDLKATLDLRIAHLREDYQHRKHA